jgi:hypothetical protein
MIEAGLLYNSVPPRLRSVVIPVAINHLSHARVRAVINKRKLNNVRLCYVAKGHETKSERPRRKRNAPSKPREVKLPITFPYRVRTLSFIVIPILLER